MSKVIIHQHFHSDHCLLNEINERIKAMAQSQADIMAKLDTLTAASIAERAEVLAALQALKDMIANGADLTAIGDRIDQEITRVQGIITDADK